MSPEQQHALCARIAEEGGEDFKIRAEFSPQAAIVLIANVQLALRHPENNRESRRIAREIIDGLIERLREEGFVAHAELAEMGNDPAHDVEAAALSRPRKMD